MATLLTWEMDRAPRHEDLSMAALEAFGRSIRHVLQESGLNKSQQRRLTEDIVWELASVFEDGRMVIGEKRFRPALRFVTELGEPVTEEGSFSLRDYAVGMVEQAFDDDPSHGYPRKA